MLMSVTTLLGQLFLQTLGHVGLVAQRRASHRGTDEGKVDTRFPEVRTDFLVLDQKLTLCIQPAIPIASGYDSFWPFRRDQRQVIDLTLGVLLSEPRDFEILGYVALPRWLTGTGTFRFTGSSSRAELFGHSDLGFLKHLV